MKKYIYPAIATLLLVVAILFYILNKTPKIDDSSEISNNHFAAVGLTQFQTEEASQEFLQNTLPQGSEETIPDSVKGNYVQITLDAGVEVWVTLDSSGNIMNVLPYFQAKNRNAVEIVKRIDPPQTYDTGGFLALVEDPAGKGGPFQFTFDSPDYRMFVTPKDLQWVRISLTLFAHRTGVYKNEAELNKETEGTLTPQEFIPADPASTTSQQSEALITGTVLDAGRIKNMITQEKFIWVSVQTKFLTLDIVGEPKIFKIIPKKGHLLEASGWLVGRIIG